MIEPGALTVWKRKRLPHPYNTLVFHQHCGHIHQKQKGGLETTAMTTPTPARQVPVYKHRNKQTKAASVSSTIYRPTEMVTNENVSRKFQTHNSKGQLQMFKQLRQRRSVFVKVAHCNIIIAIGIINMNQNGKIKSMVFIKEVHSLQCIAFYVSWHVTTDMCPSLFHVE